MKLPPLLRGLDNEIRQQELRGFIRSVALIEGLLILVVAAYWLLSPTTVRDPRARLIGLAACALLCCLFRMRSIFERQTRLKLAAECWSMALFTTFVCWQTGSVSSALLGLYLLPIIVSALALGRMMTFVQSLGICALYLLLIMVSATSVPWNSGEAAAALARLTPLMLVAFLTRTLAADVFAARRRIESRAQTDSLTGLLNLRTFHEHFRQLQLQAQNEELTYTVLMVDMDHLKSANDEFGHEAGNAQRLRNLVFNTTLDVGSRMIRSSVSIGMASFPRDGRDPQELMSLADRRMYRDKELRRRPAAVGALHS